MKAKNKCDSPSSKSALNSTSSSKNSKFKSKFKKSSKLLQKKSGPDAPVSRKELRKAERQTKKAVKNEFYQKKYNKTLPEPIKKKRRQNNRRRNRGKNQNKTVNQDGDGSSSSESLSDSEMLSSEKFKKAEEKLKRQVEEIRKKRFIEENEKEEKIIQSMRKKLKIKKSTLIPASFREDGLDYLLEFCDNLESKSNNSSLTKDKSKNSNSAEEDDDEEAQIFEQLKQAKMNKVKNQPQKVSKLSKNEDSNSESDDFDEDDEEIENLSDSEKSIPNSEEEDDEIVENYEKNSESDDNSDENEANFDENNSDEDLDDSDKNSEKEMENVSKNNDENKDELWEDIYGRMRDKAGNIIKEDKEVKNSDEVDKGSKYVPPMRRNNESNVEKIKRSLKGLLNRLSEQNMHNISKQIEELYMRHSRNEMNESLSSLFESALVGSVLSSNRIILEHDCLIAILHANIGTEIGAFFIQNFVQKFSDLYSKVESLEDNNKELENILLIIVYLYHFKIVDSSLIYDILNFLSASFGPKDIELILTVLRSVGFRLRKDDPISLKTLILNLQKKGSEIKEKGSSRVKFMLETLLAIRNNNMTKIPNYDPEYGEHLLKILKSFCHKGNYVSELKISMKDLLNADKKGKWWIVGSAWSNVDENKSENQNNLTSSSSASKFTDKLLKKAKKLGMNTDVRRNIFCIIMTAEDYLDAFEKLVHLGLKNQLEREIIHVLIHCCLHEKKFNPFYALLASKFCHMDRRFILTIQYNLWDRLKDFEKLDKNSASNLTQLLVHLINEKNLSLTVLKIIDFSDMKIKRLELLRQVLSGILLQSSTENLEEIFIKVALSEKLSLFRESLKLFMSHFLISNEKLPLSEESAYSETSGNNELIELIDEKAQIFEPQILEQLKERTKIAERAMSLGHTRIKL